MGERRRKANCRTAHLPILAIVLFASRYAQGTDCPTGNGVYTSVSSGTKNGKTTRVVSLTGCPNYSPFGEKTPNTPSCQNFVLTTYATPQLLDTPKYVSRESGTTIMGAIGYAVNGAAIYGDSDADGNDAWLVEGTSMDTCRGHSDSKGIYHYHTAPGDGCVYANTSGSSHSPMFGIMADGVPIYGEYGDNGVVPTDLDECRGHTDSTYSYYHYHVTADLASGVYTVNCLKGCILSSWSTEGGVNIVSGTCTASSTQYDYSSMSIPWSSNTDTNQCSSNTSTTSPPSPPPGTSSKKPPPSGGSTGSKKPPPGSSNSAKKPPPGSSNAASKPPPGSSNAAKKPPPGSSNGGGAKRPPPGSSNTGGSTTPPPSGGSTTNRPPGPSGGNTNRPPGPGGNTGGSSTPPPSGNTGTNTNPPPTSSTNRPPGPGGNSGGNTNRPPMMSPSTGGNTNTTPPPTGGNTGGSTASPPPTSTTNRPPGPSGGGGGGNNGGGGNGGNGGGGGGGGGRGL